MTRRLLVFFAVVTLALAAGALCASSAILVHVTGAKNMKGFAERLTQWYGMKDPTIQFTVSASSAFDAFAAVASGKAEVVQSSRRPLHSEEEALRSSQGKQYLELQVATEVAGIAVNASNPVHELSLFQLRQALSGEVKNWKNLGGENAPIVIYGRDDTSDVHAFLEEEFMGDAGISSTAKVFPTNAAMFSSLAQDPNGIGFGTAESLPNARVRFLNVKASESGQAAAPTGDAIRAKQYKLVRPLFFCFAGNPPGALNRFAKWVLTSEGQLVVEAAGYYPLSSAEREAGLQQLSAK